MSEATNYNLKSEKNHKFIDVDPDKCIGCGICELVCSMEKTEDRSFNPSKSRIRVCRFDPAINIAVACRLCEKPSCVNACPKKALSQAQSGIIHVDENKCNGCNWCIKACPYGSISIDPDKRVAALCDLCEGRKGIGVFPGRKIASPACVEWCPEEAIELLTDERLAGKARQATIVKLLYTPT